MDSATSLLKSFFTAKNMADAMFVLVILVYLGCFLFLMWREEELGFFELLAVILYSGMTILGLTVVSLVLRCVWLYRNPVARTRLQKWLLFLTTIPWWGFFLQIWFFY